MNTTDTIEENLRRTHMKTQQTDKPSIPLAHWREATNQYELDETPAQAHSPLPWAIGQDSDSTLDINYSDGEIRSRIARLHVECLCDEHSNGGIAANAAFIVRACNNAERLADACKAMMLLHEAILDSSSDKEIENDPVLSKARHARDKGIKALAQWEGDKQ